MNKRLASRKWFIGLALTALIVSLALLQITSSPQNPCLTEPSGTMAVLNDIEMPASAGFMQTELAEITPDNAKNLSQINNLNTESSVITDITFSPDGNLLAVANAQNITILDMSSDLHPKSRTKRSESIRLKS